MGRTNLTATPIFEVPSGNPLTYCRLCFSTRLCKKIVSHENAVYWIAFIHRTVGIEMILEEDKLFAICFGCRTTLESVEQFRIACRLHDAALRQFRAESGKSNTSSVLEKTVENSSTGAGECSVVPLPTAAPTPSKPSTEQTLADTMCPVCNVRFTSLILYKRHMKIAHNTVRGNDAALSQLRAGSGESNTSSVLEKTVENSSTGAGECSVIPLTTAAPTPSKPSTEQPLTDTMCLMCNVSFTTLRVYKRHMKIVHNKVRGIVACPFCPRRFRKSILFQHHVVKHSRQSNANAKCVSNNKNKQCNHCIQSFETAEELEKHEIEIHGLTFKCRLCDMRFSSKKEKHVHKIMHLACPNLRRITNFKCKICSWVFPSRLRLNIHVKKHEKYFLCTICGVQFVDLEDYVEHQTTDHQHKSILKECSLCKVVFNNREEVLNHLNRYHARYAQFDLEDDELSDSDSTLDNGTESSANAWSGNSQQLEIETVSLSSDDSLTYDENDEGYMDQGIQGGVSMDSDHANRLEEELMLDEVPLETEFDLYGTAFRRQTAEVQIEELSD